MEENQSLNELMYSEQLAAAQNQQGQGAETNEFQEENPDTAPQAAEVIKEQNMPAQENKHSSEESQELQPQINLNDIIAENEALKIQMSQLQKGLSEQANLVQEQAQAAQSNTIEQLLQQPKPLDVKIMTYGSEDEIQSETDRYNRDMLNFVEQKTKEVTDPIIQKYENETKAAEFNNTVNKLAQFDEFSDIKQRMSHINQIFERNDFLKSMPIDLAIQTAYVISRGMDSISTPPKSPKTADEILNELKNDPQTYDEIMRKFAQQNAQSIANKEALPILNASQGMSNSPANVMQKPKTLDEAFKQSLMEFQQ